MAKPIFANKCETCFDRMSCEYRRIALMAGEIDRPIIKKKPYCTQEKDNKKL